MRIPVLIVALAAASLMLGASSLADAQQQSAPAPDAPQPQKKPAAKPQASDSTSPQADKTDSKPAATSDASSSQADKTDSKAPSTKAENPFPEAVSQDAAKAAAQSSDSNPQAPKNSTATENPFPESVSRDAAKAAGNDQPPTPAAKPDVPAGVSSSQSSSSLSDTDQVNDPARAKEDAQVGSFYLKSGDYKGALLRYKDAIASDPTNVDAIFGLAETQRMLKQNAEAARNYQLYLDILPNGPKSKQALKALKGLPPG
jgi:tetratricopeptide (TPR) repeat protein